LGLKKRYTLNTENFFKRETGIFDSLGKKSILNGAKMAFLQIFCKQNNGVVSKRSIEKAPLKFLPQNIYAKVGNRWVMSFINKIKRGRFHTCSKLHKTIFYLNEKN
jgi:hypothetical protein